jgi:hypothetical protein
MVRPGSLRAHVGTHGAYPKPPANSATSTRVAPASESFRRSIARVRPVRAKKAPESCPLGRPLRIAGFPLASHNWEASLRWADAERDVRPSDFEDLATFAIASNTSHSAAGPVPAASCWRTKSSNRPSAKASDRVIIGGYLDPELHIADQGAFPDQDKDRPKPPFHHVREICLFKVGRIFGSTPAIWAADSGRHLQSSTTSFSASP